MKKKLFGTDGIRTLASDEIFRKSSLNILSKVIIKKGPHKTKNETGF